MASVSSILTTLKGKGKENLRKIYARHGMDAGRVLGVSVADLKTVAKSIKGQQELAFELYATGTMEAMYLAGMVADGSKMSKALLKEWAEGAVGLQMISEYTVPWVTVESPFGRELALEWIKSKKECIAAAGWSTYAGLVSMLPDEKLDLTEVETLLKKIEKEIHGAPNRVRYTMNTFVICAGSYVTPLMKQAIEIARSIGEVKVDMGETECKVPPATAYIHKVEAAGKLGRKKKTIRC